MTTQGRNENGKFAPKSNELRIVRSIRTTDFTWELLGELAQNEGLTRADLLEELGTIMIASEKLFLSGRVPQELWEAVDNNAKLTSRTRTQVMIAAITQYLNLPNSADDCHSKVAEIEQLENKLQQVEESLGRLTEQNAQLLQKYEDLESRLSIIESVKSDNSKKSMFPVDDIWNKHYGNGKK
jgi:predicted DNA-binding protein